MIHEEPLDMIIIVVITIMMNKWSKLKRRKEKRVKSNGRSGVSVRTLGFKLWFCGL